MGATRWEEIWEAGPYYDHLAEALEKAQDYAIFVGWQIDSRLPLKGREPLLQKVRRICEERPEFHFYFLMWDHAYFYFLERERWQGRIWDEIHPRVHFIFDNRHPFGACHHEKICIIDGKTALCGGIDVCDDRWDTPHHFYEDPRRSLDQAGEKHGPYHDLAVRVEGPVCAELQRHVAERWGAISNVPFPKPLEPDAHSLDAPPTHSLLLSRTRSSIDWGDGGDWDDDLMTREIEFLFHDLIRGARSRLIIEGQYYWSRKINRWLIEKMHAMRGKDFLLVLALADLASAKSLTRLMAPYEQRLLASLQEAARVTGTRLILGYPYVHSENDNLPPKPIYIHSKLIIVDDRYLCVGSANLTARALRTDTEVCLTLEGNTLGERAHIQAVAERCLRHWRIAVPEAGRPAPLERLHQHSHLGLKAPGPPLPLSRIPMQRFFDPEHPWHYRFKRWMRHLSRRRRHTFGMALTLAWVAGVVVTALLGHSSTSAWGIYPLLLSLLLASAWIAPVSFLPLSLLASLQWGLHPATRLMIVALWVNASWSYGITRMFPTWASRYYRDCQIGNRSFETLIWTLSDPRLELRTKFAYQGLNFTPLPWFALSSGVVMPAAFSLLCRMTTALAPSSWVDAARQHPWPPLFAILGAKTTLILLRRAISWNQHRRFRIEKATHEKDKANPENKKGSKAA